ncbi:hypothetical protein Cgig2_033708 [Carnegiea gigantea]|uniref:Uncharacterized protein n=1 Tax=Carnegiea gigantea TaxID=171969 RepID=A0A9Q1K6W4_9CARY|nr:hypothetical protein Cgig2_033708 [Carnegiea gigantea]
MFHKMNPTYVYAFWDQLHLVYQHNWDFANLEMLLRRDESYMARACIYLGAQNSLAVTFNSIFLDLNKAEILGFRRKILFLLSICFTLCLEDSSLFLSLSTLVVLFIPIKQVVSSSPPSNQIGIRSVQREVEEIAPMKSMKMESYQYTSLEKS